LSIDGYGGAQMKFLTRTRPRIFTDLAHYTQIGDLFKQGFLAPTVYHRIPGFDTAKLKANSGADYDDRSTQLYFEEIGFRARVAKVVERLLTAGRKRILVFCRWIEDCEDLIRRVPEAKTVSGETEAVERDGIIDDFRAGRIPVVVNVGVLTAGFDYPELDTVVLARPTQSLRMYMQQVGRVVRKHPDAPVKWVVDMVDVVEKFGRLEDLYLRPGGKTGEQWEFVTTGGKSVTNAYLNGKPKEPYKRPASGTNMRW
jgi:DNA repair protein RadD